MPLDPQAQYVLEQIAALGLPPNHLVSPEQARINSKARPRAAGPDVAKVEDHRIPGPGPEIPVRIYTPAGPGPFPMLVWFHGGGWVVGDLDTADPTARHLAVGAGCVVVSVDYRLAPETKFPGAADDCTRNTAQNPEDYPAHACPQFARRLVTPRPSRPRPSSASEPGSGTVPGIGDTR